MMQPLVHFFRLNFSHLFIAAASAAAPVNAITIMYTARSPLRYASTMPGTASAAKLERISVAPARMTAWGSAVGAKSGRLVRSKLSRIDCAAARAREEPTLKVTVEVSADGSEVA